MESVRARIGKNEAQATDDNMVRSASRQWPYKELIWMADEDRQEEHWQMVKDQKESA